MNLSKHVYIFVYKMISHVQKLVLRYLHLFAKSFCTRTRREKNGQVRHGVQAHSRERHNIHTLPATAVNVLFVTVQCRNN